MSGFDATDMKSCCMRECFRVVREVETTRKWNRSAESKGAKFAGRELPQAIECACKNILLLDDKEIYRLSK